MTTAAKPPVDRILLIGWDAADWKMIDPLIEAGEMPTLAQMIEDGVMANLATLHPAISPMLWNSIATGKTADKHGILGFTERDPHTGGARPFSSLSRTTKAIWNILQQALGWRCHVTNWWASHPAEPLDGITVSNYFFNTQKVGPNTWRVPKHAIHPSGLEAEFGPLRMDINEVNEHLVYPFIPRGAEIDQRNDPRLERFANLLTECCSHQAIATAVLEREPWQFAAVYSDSIDHFAHGFMTYHPPRQPHVPEADFEIYRDVMRGVYRFHDLMLARLLELAGLEATVILCSDHGFESGMLRPLDNPREPAGPTFWHRDFGILVMKGPNIKSDERIYGANLLDIVPTILTLAGLPVGRDMDGKPLLEALKDPSAPTPIDSWDTVPGRSGQHPPETIWETSVEDGDAIMQQFAALGYIDAPTADRERNGRIAEVENQYNLAQVHLSVGRPHEAVAILEELLAEFPWETRYIHQLANAYLRGGWYRAAQELLAHAYPRGDADARVPNIVWQLRVKAFIGLGEHELASDLLARLMRNMLLHAPTWVEAGWLWIELRRLDEAEVCFRRALQLDADNAYAYQGLSTIHLRRRENGAAIDAALDAVQRLHHLPVAHLNLGIALVREDRPKEAIVALRRAVGMKKRFVAGHRWLAALYATRSPDDFLAGVHRNTSQKLTREREAQRPSQLARAQEHRPLPEIPSPTERREREKQARPVPKIGETSGRSLVIVSGLPRSGTSLMMQMLAAGGLPPRTDSLRTADVDNPEGYFEWEAIKQIAREPQLLDEPGLDQKAIKVISALLPALPRNHNYKVIYMRRPAAEIAASQTKMITHRGTSGAETDEQRLAETLEAHSQGTMKFLRGQSESFQMLEIDYPALVANPEPVVRQIVDFLGPARLPHPERLTAVVRRDLHRNRSAGSSSA